MFCANGQDAPPAEENISEDITRNQTAPLNEGAVRAANKFSQNPRDLVHMVQNDQLGMPFFSQQLAENFIPSATPQNANGIKSASDDFFNGPSSSRPKFSSVPPSYRPRGLIAEAQLDEICNDVRNLDLNWAGTMFCVPTVDNLSVDEGNVYSRTEGHHNKKHYTEDDVYEYD